LKTFNFLFDVIINFRHKLYNDNFFRSKKVDTPVISIGSVTIGGAGKTPLTIAIAKILINMDYKVAILSRGYKRERSGVHEIKEFMDLYKTSADYGDEPILLALTLKNTPVVVAKDRFLGAKYIEKEIKPDVILLDDGFQYRKLLHSIDLLIFKNDFKGENETYFPFGKLRDSLSRLKNSDLIFYEKDTKHSVKEYLKKQSNIQGYDIIYELISNNEAKIDIKKPITSFCGIAKPDLFFKAIKGLNIDCEHNLKFRDHKKYQRSTIKKILSTKSNTFITTEKDFIKLPTEFIINNKILVLTMKIRFSDKKSIEKVLNDVVIKK